MTDKPTDREPLFGLIAEFGGPRRLLRAVEKSREAGYHRIEAYTPYPVEEVSEAIHEKNRLPLIVLIGGCVGGLAGFFMQYYASVISYPLVVAGKPLNSWPAFIVVTFEMTILFAALSAVLGMFALNRLPQPYHPVFHVERFGLATSDRFFLLVASTDPLFEQDETTRFLESLDPASVSEVPR